MCSLFSPRRSKSSKLNTQGKAKLVFRRRSCIILWGREREIFAILGH